MGLDMYLYKALKVAGFSELDYDKIDDKIFKNIVDEAIPLNTDYKPETLDLEALSGVKEANQLPLFMRGDIESFHWYSIFDEVGYWRKANAIHKWFVDNVQDGIDQCQTSFVSKDKLNELLSICKEIKADHSKASTLLPTQQGFFFGSTNYDEYYFADIEGTIKILENILNEDLNKWAIFYSSSW